MDLVASCSACQALNLGHSTAFSLSPHISFSFIYQHLPILFASISFSTVNAPLAITINLHSTITLGNHLTTPRCCWWADKQSINQYTSVISFFSSPWYTIHLIYQLLLTTLSPICYHHITTLHNIHVLVIIHLFNSPYKIKAEIFLVFTHIQHNSFCQEF